MRNKHNNIAPSVGPNRAARIIGVNPTSIQRWVDSGDLPAHRTHGGHRRIALFDLEEFARKTGLPYEESAITITTDGSREDPTRPLRVLAVDDDVTFLNWFCAGLETISKDTRPLEILSATSGFTAGQLLATSDPDIVFLDIRMPGMSGTEICRLIKSDPRTADIRVLGITAVRSSDVIEEFVSAGAEWVFRKPIDMADIEEILGEVVLRGAERDERARAVTA